MVKNTWTRIAARWNDEDQNKVNIDTNAAEYCGSFEYDIMHLADYLTQSNFVNDRVKKISDATFNIFETNGTFYVLTENGYDISDDVQAGDNFDTYPEDINELLTTIQDIGKQQQKYNRDMNYLIKSFEKNKNDKVKNYKIIKELEKFEGAVNQFYYLLNQEYNNVEKFEPFYVIINKEYNELLTDRFYPAEDEEDVAQYSSKESAQDNMRDMIEEINSQTDEGVQKGNIIISDDSDGHYTENDFEIILINSMKQYNDLLKKMALK